MKKFFLRILAGIGIGIGAAIPGVSGAGIAVVFKVYEEIIESISGIRKHFGYSFKVLIAIIIGILISLIPCIYLFSFAFEHCMFILLSVFAGFLIGSLPSITDEVKGVKPSRKHMVLIGICIVFVIILGVLSIVLGPKINLQSQFDEMPVWLYFVLIPVGALAGAGLIIPGLSGSLFLLILGFYRPMIDHATEWMNLIFKEGSMESLGKLFGLFASFGVGALIGLVLVSLLMNYLIKNKRNATYFGIIGLVIGSAFVLYFNVEIYQYYSSWAGKSIPNINPSMPIYLEIIIGIIALAITMLLSYGMVKLQRKYQTENKEKVATSN